MLTQVLKPALVPWLVGGTLLLVLHSAMDRTYVALLISSFITLIDSDVSPFGILNSTVIPVIINLVVWSVAVFISLALFLNIEHRGLQFKLRSIFITIGLLALIVGVSANTPDPTNRFKPVLIILVCFLITGISMFHAVKVLLKANT